MGVKETSRYKVERGQEYYLKLADKLDELQKKENNGRGVNVIRNIAAYLGQGMIGVAKEACFHDADKLRGHYPEIEEVLRNELFESSEDNPWAQFERIRQLRNL